MKLKDKFNLSHVEGFFVGVVVTVLFNWIVFKDPKRVTAPGVAALVAICTFGLALWSALKVNKWLDNKVNETGFKQTEKILEHLEQFRDKVTPITTKVDNIIALSTAYTKPEFDTETHEEHIKLAENLECYCDNFTIKIFMLKHWGVELSSNANVLIVDFIKHLRECISIFKLYNNCTNMDEHKQKMGDFKANISIAYRQFDELTNLSYNDIFIHKVTSPLKKVD